MERTITTAEAIHLSPDAPSEQALIKSCQEGDKGAFKVLVERYQQRAMRVASGFVRSRDDSKGVVQEAFVRAFKSIREFRNESQFYRWFHVILVNVALDHLRRNKTLTQSDGDGLLLHSSIASEAKLNRTDPREEIWTKQRRKAIVRAIDSLPVDERMTIILREIEDLSYEEIAEFTRVPIGTVMSRVFVGRRRLQFKLGEFADPPTRLNL
ncbi:MAG: hypothetical protein A2Y63_04295 [Candidatus Riflebacteria bacterium RBG_13_59_9]|jgi:RNA polymerase sigma-70 factor (ECF subfamily)|nr:MAG: hypothetical protein A2Y63_04295 [Candidatus Riflebacteria bacterium RBG_13_59_9]